MKVKLSKWNFDRFVATCKDKKTQVKETFSLKNEPLLMIWNHSERSEPFEHHPVPLYLQRQGFNKDIGFLKHSQK